MPWRYIMMIALVKFAAAEQLPNSRSYDSVAKECLPHLNFASLYEPTSLLTSQREILEVESFMSQKSNLKTRRKNRLPIKKYIRVYVFYFLPKMQIES
jgi:hypothetical protein